MSVRVIPGEIDARDATARTAIPTVAQPRWPPFERIAETIATPRRRVPQHRHEGVEVLTYVVEGSATYAFGTGPAEPLSAGSVRLLSAPTSVTHAITPGKGGTVRSFAVVAQLPAGRIAEVRLQSGQAVASPVQPDGTILRPIVGPGTSLTSAVGLAVEAIEYTSLGTVFRKVGHDRVAVIYALSGRGKVDDSALDGGEAALVDDAAGVAVQGHPGFRVVWVSAPRPS
jgi:redox-sensitive bicupin YhaK (pirin superfamily)